MTAELGWRVPLSDVLVDDDLRAVVLEALDSGWWSMGPRVADFEGRFAAFVGSPHALAVSSGTAALHLALLAVDVGPGDEVVVPSLNFVAAANAVSRVGARAVFCDVNGAHDLNLDPNDVAAAISDRTRAVIVLHYAGYGCDMDAVMEIADRTGMAVIEDAAHAPGGTRRGRSLGTIGSVGCFSFFANKNLPVGEGGMVVTSDDRIGERLALLRSHGMTTLTWQRHAGHASSYDVVEAGFNYRLDELRAAVAALQLDRLEATNAARFHHARNYRALLAGVDGIGFPFDATAESAHHLVVVVLPADVSREAIRERLRSARIQTSVHYPPTHRFAAYAEAATRPLPQTDAVADRILTLPLFAHMTDGDVELVADILLRAVAEERS